MFVLWPRGAGGFFSQPPLGAGPTPGGGFAPPTPPPQTRRYAILVIAVLAMLLPGQDPVTMTMMMAPMYVLFEGSILLSWLLDRRAASAHADDEDFEDLEETSLSPEPVHVTRDQD